MALPPPSGICHPEGMSIVITQPQSPPTMMHHRILVGFDGSRGSVEAVHWAACEAQRRSSALGVMTCWAVPAHVDFYGVGARQHQGLAAMVDDIRCRYPKLVIGATATHLDPRDALIAETENADLLVIGSTEMGVARQMLLGTVARTAARRSACPAVVVNGSGRRPIRRIVVGVDGSSAAATALEWACDEANLRGSVLCIVQAREAAQHEQGRQVLDRAVAECRSRTTTQVTAELVEGPAVAALIRASEDADLVVIGSRGRSGFKTALFGSVALTVADESACPVVITHLRNQA